MEKQIKLAKQGDFMQRNGTLVLNQETFYSTTDEEKKQARRVIIEEGVTSLGIGAFAESQNLVEVILPETLTDLGFATFMNCHNLQRINIPDNIKVITQMTFYRCSSLTEIELPLQLEEIYLGAFFGCCNLRYITLPDSVKTIGEGVFGGCQCIDQLIHDYPHLIKHANIFDYEIKDLIRIFKENLDNADLFDLAHNLSGGQWASLLANIPELAYRCPWKKITPSAWAWLLARQPQFAQWCPWNKLNGLYLVDLLRQQGQFAEKCTLKRATPACQTAILAKLPHLARFLDWEKIYVPDIFHDYKADLAQFKLEYIPTLAEWQSLMYSFYSPGNGRRKGLFADGVEDAATYMIYKSMDKENAKLFLKEQFFNEKWDFLEDLCDISPDELINLPGKKKMPFFIALSCPDNIFYKFFQSADFTLHDKTGNSVLFPALVHDLLNGRLDRFNFLTQKGVDPDEKNLAGFSCNDMIKHFSNKI